MNGRPPCGIGLQQGGMIMDSFQVTCRGVPVGEVTMELLGLYCRIRCVCTVRQGVYRLLDRRDTGDFSVGICEPIQGGYGLDKKIPSKYMDTGSHCFVLMDIHEQKGAFYPISETMPLSVLSQPEKCRFEVRDNVPWIVVKNC